MWQNFKVVDVKFFSCHRGEVNCCAFSPNCQLMLTCSDDRGLYLWRASDGKLVAKARSHTGPVKWCAFSTDGCLFASASYDCTARVWCTSTAQCVHVFTGHMRSVETVSFSVDGRWLVSGGWDNIALLWDTQSGVKLREFLGHTGAVQSSAFSTDTDWLATGSWDHSVKVWSLRDDKEVVTLVGHQGNVACLCFSATGMLASGSWDGTVRVWSPKMHSCMFVLGGDTHVWVRSVAFSKDGLLLASTAEGDKVKIWNMADGRCIKSLQGHLDSAYGCVFSPSGTLLTSGSDQLDLEGEDYEDYKKGKDKKTESRNH